MRDIYNYSYVLLKFGIQFDASSRISQKKVEIASPSKFENLLHGIIDDLLSS